MILLTNIDFLRNCPKFHILIKIVTLKVLLESDRLPASTLYIFYCRDSGVARAFPGGRIAHTEAQNEEENK